MKKRKLLPVLAAALGILAVGIAGILLINLKERNNRMKLEAFHTQTFGEHVFFFRESDDHTAIQETIDAVYKEMEANQFGEERYALCFFPGDYSDLTVRVGFYTQVLGLGTRPTDVKIGTLTCSARWLGDDGNHNATQNFWRSVENVEIRSNTMWAVSQATDMRRVQIDGSLHLHDSYGWASGGFLSDSRILGMIDSGSQQQWLSRNNQYRTWIGENWNIVFVGDEPEGLPTGTWPAKSYTAVAQAPEISEKPLLLWTDPEKADTLGVLVPERRRDAVGLTWAQADDVDYSDLSWDVEEVRKYAREISPEVTGSLGEIPESFGHVSSFSDWYVASPESDTAVSITEALQNGKNILFTPGVYELTEPIKAGSDRILLGLGLASLKAAGANTCLETNGDDIRIAGLLFDAGPALTGADGTERMTEELLHIGEGKNVDLSDLYFRVGGTRTSSPAVARRCVTVDADRTIGDNLWVWRADHGDQVAWTKNRTENGIVINGEDVIMYALMVEHFHEYQTVWNGNGGRLYMYQSEVPYDVPREEVWMSHDGERYGYASIYVADPVTDFHGEGIGIYLFNRDASVRLQSVMEMPDREGVSVHHIISVMITGNPGALRVINDAGAPVVTPGATAILLDYENGVYR